MSGAENPSLIVTDSGLRSSVEALHALGLSANEFAAYELLIEHPGMYVTEIAQRLGLPSEHASPLLDRLEKQGLVSGSLGSPPRFCAAQPDIALGALIAKRQSGLQEASVLAQQLAAKKPAIKAGDEDEITVELITGRDSLIRVIQQFYHGAKHEIIELDRPPYLNTFQGHDRIREEVFKRNVTFRSIVDTTSLEVPGRLQHIHDSVAAGEQIRVFDGVPIKAAIIDRNMALVPLHLRTASDSGLLMRPSLLLDVLCAYFETLWEQAAPFASDKSGSTAKSTPKSDGTSALLALLINGLNDKTIAHRLNISERTVERRVAELQKQFCARTRFQAGWKAAKWLQDK